MGKTTEFIDREKARDIVCSLCRWEGTSNCVECEHPIDAIPAADVRPVIKAKWVYTSMSRLVCSNCGNPVAFALKDDGWHHGDFCPNCGADMREES